MPPFFMSSERYDFYDDDHYDGAAVMVIRGRKERLEHIFNLDTNEQESSINN